MNRISIKNKLLHKMKFINSKDKEYDVILEDYEKTERYDK